VIRSGRLLPVDGIEQAVCPMVTVSPIRINLGCSQSLLETVQRDITVIIKNEHIPLAKVQQWAQPAHGRLFDLLFSVTTAEPTSTSTWSKVESRPPRADVSILPSVSVYIN
jgi:ferricrocin synthase